MRRSCLTVISRFECSPARCAMSQTPPARKPTVKARGCSSPAPRCCFTGVGWPRLILAWSPGTRRGSRSRGGRRRHLRVAARQIRIRRCPSERGACCRTGQTADARKVPGVRVDRPDDHEQDHRRNSLLALPRMWRGVERRPPQGSAALAGPSMVTVRRDAARAPVCRIEQTPEEPPGYNRNRSGRSIPGFARRVVASSRMSHSCTESRQ